MSAEQKWGQILRDGTTVYTLMHAGWRKGVEQFKNRVWLSVCEDREAPGEAEAFAARIEKCLNACAGLKDPQSELIAWHDEIMRLRADAERHAELQARCFDYGNPTGSSIFDEVRELRAQRDRLLAALNQCQRILNTSSDDSGWAGKIDDIEAVVDAAIAECGGQQP